jgi:hypothetical protein
VAIANNAFFIFIFVRVIMSLHRSQISKDL